jgi:putative transposase
MGVKARAARSRELIAKGGRPAIVARVLQVNRTGLYRKPRRRPASARVAVVDPVDRLIVEVAHANPSDGTRMVAALASQRLGREVNRKRAQRVMRQQRLLQRHRPLRRRRRPGFFRVERPDQLWHLDMTSIWVADHGWTYLNAIIDCCTREIVGWSLELRCRTDEAIELVDGAVTHHGIPAETMTLGTDNGSAFTSRRFKTRLAELGVTHRRGGYRDPRARPSSRAGSGSSSSGSCGAPNSRRSTRPALRSPPTSRPTTTDRTPACATAPRHRSDRPGRMDSDY